MLERSANRWSVRCILTCPVLDVAHQLPDMFLSFLRNLNFLTFSIDQGITEAGIKTNGVAKIFNRLTHKADRQFFKHTSQRSPRRQEAFETRCTAQCHSR